MKSPILVLRPVAAILFLAAGAIAAAGQTPGPSTQTPGPSAQATAPSAQTPSAVTPLDESTGVLVVGVEKGGPAEAAGIVRGDIILTVGGTAVNDARALRDIVIGHASGDTIAITLSVRSPGGAARDVAVTLGKNPSKDAPYLGIEYTVAAGVRGGGWPFPWWRHSDRWPGAPTL